MENNCLLAVLLCILICLVSCKEKEPLEQEPAKEEYPKQLTQGNLLDQRAYFSPDGKYIAFYSMRYTFNPEVAWSPQELWTMHRDGFEQRRVILKNSIHELTTPTLIGWTNDSKSMIVQIDEGDYDANSEIWEVAVTGERTKLYAPNLRLERLTYSPDKSKVAYIIQGPNPPVGPPVFKLYVANTDFSDSIRIEKGLVTEFEWQNDSKGLIYSSYDLQDHHHYLWKAAIDGRSILKFSTTPLYNEYFSCSSDGKYISYSVSDTVYITPSDIFLPHKIMENVRGGTWIPERNMLLVFDEQTNGSGGYWTECWIIDIHGNIIKKFPKNVYYLSFYSDGHQFLYTSNGDIWLDYLL